HHCKRGGASRMAYPPVVAAGPDACTIHYSRNDKVIRDGQLVLMDAGCELHGYCSDVTRTWPVSGRFTPAQRLVYSTVLHTHNQCIKACKPGVSIRDLHNLSVLLISEGLQRLGVCGQVSADQIAGLGLYRRFYRHSVGHFLGLDTHDTPLMTHNRPLQAGNVITIEPGLYIPNDPVFGMLRGIGVRLEDDVLVTATGCE
ncbi:putative Xaa-Pro aminopeptidase 3 isoform X1, partial [Haematococcus lacustris]